MMESRPEAVRLAHRLKGSSANISAEELSGLAGKVEKDAKRSDWDDALVNFHCLEKAHSRVRQYLLAWLDQHR